MVYNISAMIFIYFCDKLWYATLQIFNSIDLIQDLSMEIIFVFTKIAIKRLG